MGSLRRLAVGLCLILLAPAPPICAQTLPTANPLRLFATCTGRLSAVMEFHWLMQDKAADATEGLRDQMTELLAAVPQGDAVTAMDPRLQAKVAETALLSEAAFGQDLTRAGYARIRAQALAGECTALLLAQARA